MMLLSYGMIYVSMSMQYDIVLFMFDLH